MLTMHLTGPSEHFEPVFPSLSQYLIFVFVGQLSVCCSAASVILLREML